MSTLRPLLGALALVALLLARTVPAPAEEIVVSAAASLTNALAAVQQKFEASHPGVSVIANFGAAGALLRQMESGAPVDVFASADQKFMDEAAAKGLIDPATRRNFAKNVMVLVVPADRKAPLASIQDLARPEIRRIAMGSPETTPLGRDARAYLMAAGLWPGVQAKIIYGETVRQVLDYVSRGEVDAAFVFATDALQAGTKVRVARFLENAGTFLYPAAVASASRKPAARAFVDFLSGPEGQTTLHSFGFLKP